MLMDDATFPLVRMHYDRIGGEDDQSGFATFETLLSQDQPFVLIGLGGSSEAHDHSPEERKFIALWMKRHREPLHRLVRAMLYVEPEPTRQSEAMDKAPMFAKAWGFPMTVVTSEDEAELVAKRLLIEE